MNWPALLLVPLASSFALAVLWRRRVLKWFVASVPWWMVANSSGWFEFVAAMLTLGGIIALAVGPTLPGRRRGRGKADPLPQMANGPLAPVLARAYSTARRSRPLEIVTIVIFCLTCALGIAAAMGAPVEVTGLALAGLIITLTFAFSLWFSGRVRVRIDQHGLHSRIFFAEQTIPWPDVAGITIRYVFLGIGVRVVYYVVFSNTHEFSFPSSITGAKELQQAIEAATGLTFPEPEITPNF